MMIDVAVMISFAVGFVEDTDDDVDANPWAGDVGDDDVVVVVVEVEEDPSISIIALPAADDVRTNVKRCDVR